MRELKVWGGFIFDNGNKQRRAIVADYSKAAAVRLLQSTNHGRGISISYFNDYWSETGNEQALATATHPGVWVLCEVYQPLT